ncbi:MAG: ParB/RepB/Spo0J family partition protein [Agathobacter sp.]|nr:ParB/RepB/Spo0J family partition protein [Agathobacter sp.]
MQKTEKDIVFIKVQQLYPHPDNPRKEVGDVSELAESIKKNGIMQNLTVIPLSALDTEAEEQPPADEISLLSDFHVLIGHRRLAACRKAGIEEVPCKIVSNISKREQVSIMLEENMQRNDLTIYEQAQGFQMMLDLGENAESIAEKTGFSKSTVYHRLNLAKLDPEELKKKQDNESYQISLKDLYELEKVSDVEKRNEILKNSKNSNDIAWRVNQAVREAKEAQRKKEIIETLENAGVEDATKTLLNERFNGNWKYLESFYYHETKPLDIAFEGEKKKYYMVANSWIGVYEEANEEVQKEKSAEQLEREKRDKNRSVLKDIENKMEKRRVAFIESIVSGELKVDIDETTKDEIWKCLISEDDYATGSELIGFLSDKPIYKLSEEEEDAYYEKLQQLDAWKTMLIALCVSMDNIGSVVDYRGEYIADNACRYAKGNKLLAKYGWYLEKEEQQLLDGTHELYEKENVNK